MKTTYLKIMFFGILLVTTLLSSCSKYAKKIADTYTGRLFRNDTIISENQEVIIEEIDNDIVSVVSDAFPKYEVKIDKKRYFGSKFYNSVYPNEELEVNDGVITLTHKNEEDSFTFYGSSN